jgi:hypothetical protein
MMTQGELTTWWEALRVWWQSQDPEELGAALLGVRAADREAVLAEVSYDGLRAEVRQLLARMEALARAAEARRLT